MGIMACLVYLHYRIESDNAAFPGSVMCRGMEFMTVISAEMVSLIEKQWDH